MKRSRYSAHEPSHNIVIIATFLIFSAYVLSLGNELSHNFRARSKFKVYVHWHFGASGGSAIRNFFEKDTNGSYAVFINPPSASRIEGLCEKDLYIEYHCKYPLHYAMKEIRTLRRLVGSCSAQIMTFTVLRNPLDSLCSAKRHRHADYADFLQNRVHNPYVMHAKYGVEYCGRNNVSNMKIEVEDMMSASQMLADLDAVVEFNNLSNWFAETFNQSLESQRPVPYSCILPNDVRFPVYDQVLYDVHVRPTQHQVTYWSGAAEQFRPPHLFMHLDLNNLASRNLTNLLARRYLNTCVKTGHGITALDPNLLGSDLNVAEHPELPTATYEINISDHSTNRSATQSLTRDGNLHPRPQSALPNCLLISSELHISTWAQIFMEHRSSLEHVWKVGLLPCGTSTEDFYNFCEISVSNTSSEQQSCGDESIRCERLEQFVNRSLEDNFDEVIVFAHDAQSELFTFLDRHLPKRIFRLEGADGPSERTEGHFPGLGECQKKMLDVVISQSFLYRFCTDSLAHRNIINMSLK